jgi:hypothetical protein
LGNKTKNNPPQHKRGGQKKARLKGRLKQSGFKLPEKFFRPLRQETYGAAGAAAIMIKNGKAVVFREKGGDNKTKTKTHPKKPHPVHCGLSAAGDPARHFLQVP